MSNYFENEIVNARCKNMKCEKYPVNLIKGKSAKTLYTQQKKKYFLIKLPKMLKMMFKKYTYNRWGGSRISTEVDIPIIFKQDVLSDFQY